MVEVDCGMENQLAYAMAKQIYRMAYNAESGSAEQKKDAGLAAAQQFLRDANVPDANELSWKVEEDYLAMPYQIRSFMRKG